MEDSDKLLSELLKLAADKDIPYTVPQIKKMNDDQRREVYQEHQVRELDAVNETFADMAIIKFEEILKSNSWIKETPNLPRSSKTVKSLNEMSR